MEHPLTEGKKQGIGVAPNHRGKGGWGKPGKIPRNEWGMKKPTR